MWAARILRVVIAAQCVGLALPVLLGKDHSVINSYLWFEFGWESNALILFDQIAAWTILALGAITLVLPLWPVVLLIATWFLQVALATWYTDVGLFPQVTIFAHAIRFMSPLALLCFQPWPFRVTRSVKRAGLAAFLLSCGIGSTFIAHGYEAFCLHAGFVDYIIVSADRLLAMNVEQSDAEWTLRLIGVVDVIVGVCMIGCSPRVGKVVQTYAKRMANVGNGSRKKSESPMPWSTRLRVGIAAGVAVAWLNTFREPADGAARLTAWSEATFNVAIDAWIWNDALAVGSGLFACWLVAHWRLLTLWLALWGIVTAFSRVTAADWSYVHETLIRAANGGAALALFAYWLGANPKPTTETVSEKRQRKRKREPQKMAELY